MTFFRQLAIVLLLTSAVVWGQTPNKRLILKDGSYQITRQYQVVGDVVRFISAERTGEWEEIPTSLIDWVATEKWARDHAPGSAEKPNGAAVTPGSAAAAELDKEAEAERMEQDKRTPVIAPGLRLPDSEGVWALDTFHDTPELVHVEQSNGDLGRSSTKNVLKGTINPSSGKAQILLEGARSRTRLHVNDPVIFVSLEGGEADDSSTEAFTVDTGKAGNDKREQPKGSANSRYAIVRVETRKDLRVVGSMNLSMLGKSSHSEDIVETTSEVLPGKNWMKLVPKQPLDIGEYALVEIISPKEINLAVWDFRVDPASPENLNARLPIPQKH
jgi:hypothetical protein